MTLIKLHRKTKILKSEGNNPSEILKKKWKWINWKLQHISGHVNIKFKDLKIKSLWKL